MNKIIVTSNHTLVHTFTCIIATYRLYYGTKQQQVNLKSCEGHRAYALFSRLFPCPARAAACFCAAFSLRSACRAAFLRSFLVFFFVLFIGDVFGAGLFCIFFSVLLFAFFVCVCVMPFRDAVDAAFCTTFCGAFMASLGCSVVLSSLLLGVLWCVGGFLFVCIRMYVCV